MFDWIVAVVSQAGYLGVAALMFSENIFPPIPSELIMPLAGFAAARGELSFAGVLIAGTLGSVAGLHVWYEIGRAIGADRLKRWSARHGRWLGIAPDEVDAAESWFHRHGRYAVLLGRLVPTVRTLISVPAGIACMDRWRFLLYSTIGTAIWAGFLTYLGTALDSRYEQVSAWLNPVTNVVVLVLGAIYVYRVATFDQRVAAAKT